MLKWSKCIVTDRLIANVGHVTSCLLSYLDYTHFPRALLKEACTSALTCLCLSYHICFCFGLCHVSTHVLSLVVSLMCCKHSHLFICVFIPLHVTSCFTQYWFSVSQPERYRTFVSVFLSSFLDLVLILFFCFFCFWIVLAFVVYTSSDPCLHFILNTIWICLPASQ